MRMGWNGCHSDDIDGAVNTLVVDGYSFGVSVSTWNGPVVSGNSLDFCIVIFDVFGGHSP